MIRLFFVFSINVLFHVSYSQSTVTTINVPGRVEDIRGMMIDDDIFLSIEFLIANAKPTFISYFIHPDGSRTEVDLKMIAGKPIIAGIRRDMKTYFYYLDEVSKQAVIRCFLIDNSGLGSLLPETIDVPGKIYGSYIEHGDLFMLCALKKEFTLKLLRMRDGRLANETSFALPFDLGSGKGDMVSFYETSLLTTPKQASASIKIIKDRNSIWITIDEPFRDYGQPVTESSIFKTTVVKLDLLAEKTSIKSFFEKQWYPFTSAIFNGNLYRLILKPKESSVDVFNFQSGNKIRTFNLLRGNEPGRDSTYARIGSYLKTEKDVKGANIVKRVLGNLFIVDSLSATEHLLTVGHYGDQMIRLTGISSVLSVVMTATSLLVAELVQGPYSCVYYYYAGSSSTGYSATYKTPLLRQVIDDYEYNLLMDKVRFDYKGYLYKPSRTYAIYQRHKTKAIEIIRFEK